MTVGNIRTLAGAYRKFVSARQKYGVPCETGSTDLLADESELFQCQGKIIHFIVYCYSICWFNGSAIKYQTSLQSIGTLCSKISGVKDTCVRIRCYCATSVFGLLSSRCCPQTALVHSVIQWHSFLWRTNRLSRSLIASIRLLNFVSYFKCLKSFMGDFTQ